MEIPFKVSVGSLGSCLDMCLSVVLLQHLDMEIPFKVSLGYVVLLQHLDMEIPFMVSLGSVVLWQHLDMEIPCKVPCTLSFCCNILTWKFPSRCPWAL